MNALGIDPGVPCGYAVVRSQGGNLILLTAETLSPPRHLTAYAERAYWVALQLVEVYTVYLPHLVAIEQPIIAGPKAGKGADALNLSMQVGMTYALLHQVAHPNRTEPIMFINPATIKARFAGSGRATKDTMLRAAKVQFGIDLGRATHAADAVAVATVALSRHHAEWYGLTPKKGART